MKIAQSWALQNRSTPAWSTSVRNESELEVKVRDERSDDGGGGLTARCGPGLEVMDVG